MIESIHELKKTPWQVAVEADGWELAATHFVHLGLGLAIVNGCCKLPRGTTGVPIRDFTGTKHYLLSRRNHRLTDAQEMLRQLIVDANWFGCGM